MRHGAGAAPLHGQAGLGAVERLDLRLLIDRQHHGMRRRVDIEADDVPEPGHEVGIVGELEAADAMRRQAPDAVAFRRTPQEVLHIVYLNDKAGTSSGGFYPKGMNGSIK